MSRALVLALAALAGCATIDVYHYQARPLPAGSEPLAVVSWTLQDLRNVTWSCGEPNPDPSRRATLEATTGGVTANAGVTAQGSPLDLTYSEIANGVHMVTQSSGTWTVYIYDRHSRLIQMEFSSYAAARLFLDAATALAVPQNVAVATIKN
jgi:hypothetical protein